MRDTFNPDRMISIIDELAAEIEPEMAMNVERWPRPASVTDWQREVEVLRNFARRRPSIILQYLTQHLHLNEAEIALFP